MKKSFKRVIASLLVAIMIAMPFNCAFDFSILSSAEDSTLAATGQCGENVTYTFDSATGLLTISGTGNLPDYNANSPFFRSSEIKTVVIEYGITSIGNEVFRECTSLISVTIPSSVTSIGTHAFSDCASLASVTIPENVTSISYWAFLRCTGLESIVVDKNNTVYDSRDNCNAIIETSTNKLLVGCQNTTIPNSVTCIYTYAFRDCTTLTSIVIPENVTSIEYSSFKGCANLTSIVVNENNTVFDSRDNCNAIIETSTNELIAGCNNSTIPNGVTSIGESVFENCTGLTNMKIPDGVTSIGFNAFYGCTGLTSITIPNTVTSIGNQAFFSCTGLKSITIPNSVTSIGRSAFVGTSLESIVVDKDNTVYDSRDNCNAIIQTSLNSLIQGCKNTIIPNSVTRIGQTAFNGCTGLTSIAIPNSVTLIGLSAFAGCTGLTNIKIPYSVRTIAQSAFDGCTGLTSVTIPSSVTNMEPYIFSRCTNLKTVIFADGTTLIPIDALNGASNVKKIIIPSSVTSIGIRAFDGCTGLTDIYYAGSNGTFIQSRINNLSGVTIHTNYSHTHSYTSTITKQPTCTEEGETTYTCDCGNTYKEPIEKTEHKFEHKIVNATCISNGEEYDYCTECKQKYNIKTIVTSGHQYENGFCTVCGAGLEWNYKNEDGKITLTEYIGSESVIHIPSAIMGTSVTAIGESAFAGNDTIKYVYIPNGVETIGDNAFANCTCLKEVFMGNSVKTVGVNAFANSDKLALVCTTSENILFNSSFANNDYRLNILVPSSTQSENNLKSLGIKYNTFYVSNKKDNQETISITGETVLYQHLDYNYWSELIAIHPNASYLYFDKLTFDGIEQDQEIQLGADGHIVSDAQSFTLEKIYIGARFKGEQITFSDLIDYLNGNDRSTQVFFVDDEGKEKSFFEKVSDFFTSALNAFSRAINRIVKLFKKKK